MNASGLVDYDSSSDESESKISTEQITSYKAENTATIKAHEEIEIDGVLSEPQGEADPNVIANIQKYICDMESKKKQDKHNTSPKSFQEQLREKKEVMNPYILERIVDYFDIDSYASNFTKSVFDPRSYKLHEYSDALAIAQKKEHERKLKQFDNRSCIQFQSASTDI